MIPKAPPIPKATPHNRDAFIIAWMIRYGGTPHNAWRVWSVEVHANQT